MKIAGLDIGTTGCKLTVFDETGHDLGKAYRDYPVRRQVSGHEIDISVVMDSVYAVIREMAAKSPDIGGIGVTSFGETFVMTDGVHVSCFDQKGIQISAADPIRVSNVGQG